MSTSRISQILRSALSKPGLESEETPLTPEGTATPGDAPKEGEGQEIANVDSGCPVEGGEATVTDPAQQPESVEVTPAGAQPEAIDVSVESRIADLSKNRLEKKLKKAEKDHEENQYFLADSKKILASLKSDLSKEKDPSKKSALSGKIAKVEAEIKDLLADDSDTLKHISELKKELASVSQEVKVSNESLLLAGAIAALVGVIAYKSADKAKKLQLEHAELLKKIELAKGKLVEIETKAEDEVLARIKREKHADKADEIEEFIKEQRKGGKAASIAAGGLTALATFITPLGALYAGAMAVVLAANKVALMKAEKELADLQAQLANKELEIAQAAADAKPEVSQEALRDPQVARSLELAESIVSANTETPEAEVVVEEAAVAADPVEVAEAERLPAEIVEAEVDVDNATTAVDELDRARRRLETVRDRLADTLDEGGVTPQAAALVQDTVDDVSETIGESAEVPSVEHFGGESSRYSATVASMEAISDLAKKVGKAILEALKKVKEFILKLVGKMVQYLGTVGMRNDQLQKRLDAAKSGEWKSGEVDLGGTYATIATGHSVDLNAFASLPGMVDQSLNFDSNLEAAMMDDYKLIVDLATKPRENLDEAALLAGRGQIDIASKLGIPAIFKNKSEDDSASYYSTDPLPGNVKLVITRRKVPVGMGNSSLVQWFASNLWTVTQESVGEKAVEGESKAPILSPADVQKIVTTVKALKALGPKIDKQKSMDKLTFSDLQMADGLSDEQRKLVEKLMSAFARRIADARKVSSKSLAYTLRVASGFQTYGFKSVDAATGKQAAKAE